MLLVLSCYKFKLVLSLQDVKFNPVVTTKKTTVEYTQKALRQEFTYFTTKKQLKKRGSSAGNEGQKLLQAHRNTKAGVSPSLSVIT